MRNNIDEIFRALGALVFKKDKQTTIQKLKELAIKYDELAIKLNIDDEDALDFVNYESLREIYTEEQSDCIAIRSYIDLLIDSISTQAERNSK